MSNIKFGPHVVAVDRQLEAEASEHGAHAVVVGHGKRLDVIEVLVACHFNEPANQLGTDAVPLKVVCDEHGNFGIVAF